MELMGATCNRITMYQRLKRFKDQQNILLFGHSDGNEDAGAMGGAEGEGGGQWWMHQLRGGI
jgi:hypothetical protein